MEIAKTPQQKEQAVALKEAFDCVLTRLEQGYEKSQGLRAGSVASGEVNRTDFESYVNGLSKEDIERAVELVRERHQGYIDAVEVYEEKGLKDEGEEEDNQKIRSRLDVLEEVYLRSAGIL